MKTLKKLISAILCLIMVCVVCAVATSANSTKKTRYTVLVLDTSNESVFLKDGVEIYTASTAIEHVKKASSRFLTKLSYSDDINYVAVVSFKDTSSVVSEFSTHYDEMKTSVNDLSASSNSRDIAAGLKSAYSLLAEINDNNAIKNIVLFTTGVSNEGDYSYSGHFDSSVVGSNWHRVDSGIELYAYANCAFEQADVIKEAGINIYTIGIFQEFEGMPSEGQNAVEFFKKTARELATSEEYFYDVDNVDRLEFTFGIIADDINEKETDASKLWKPEKFFKSPNIDYNSDLAYVCSVTCEQSADKDKMTAHYESLDFANENISTHNYNDGSEDELGCHGIAAKEFEEFNLLFITIRGSKSAREFFLDATTNDSKEFYGYKAYDVVYDIYTSVMSNASDFIDNHQFLKTNGKTTKILITGHSLGGASANMISACFNNLARDYGDFNGIKFTVDDIYSYTFGAINPISDRYHKNGKKITPLPIVSGYENIHNVYNYHDCFGPNMLVDKIVRAGTLTGIQKFGVFHCFSSFSRDATSHAETTYIDAVFHKKVYEIGTNYIHEGTGGPGKIYVHICCPVDVEVLDNNRTVCKVENNKVSMCDSSVECKIIDGDMKLITLPESGDYSLNITAFDDGEMTCTVIKSTANSSGVKNFSNVKLTKGKTLVSRINKNIDIEDTELLVQNLNETNNDDNEANSLNISPDDNISPVESNAGNNRLIIAIVLTSLFILALIFAIIILMLYEDRKRKIK